MFVRTMLFAVGLLTVTAGFSQLNMSLIGQVDYLALHNVDLNDCWGYVDETGVEYALVGTTAGTSIVSLADPANPVEVFWEPGSQSVWRDLQVYGDYAYITTEADDGLLIIDLSPLPASANLPVNYYFGPANNSWSSAHDVFVDTTGGWAYICGANRGNGGMIILDIHTDPMNPVEVGEFDNWYCHDAFAQGNLLYGAHISDGFLSIIDVTDHSNPVLLNTQITPNSFTHNVWVTSDDHYAVTTDEIAGAYLTLYDVSDPMNIQETDRIRSSPGLNIIPHNAFILGDSLIVSSYYTDGITIHDMSRPHNLVEIASYDTHPLETGTFNGSWGAYPFLPSGLMLASDISEGLFVLQPELVRAAYFEGLVRDASNLNPLPDVKVTIAADPQTDLTNAQGEFAVGTVQTGTFDVTFYKVAYYPQTISIDFASGLVALDTIDLVPIPPFPLTVIVEDQSGNPVIGADVRIEVTEMTQENTSNGFGESDFNLYYPGNSHVTVGKWGYKTHCADYVLDETTGTLIVQLTTGYYDDFSFDFGWTTADNGVTSGLWERGIPNTDPDHAAPAEDALFDCGKYAYVTGNDLVTTSDQDDLDGGRVWLYSPVFDLTTQPDAYLYYECWFFCFHGPAGVEDTLEVWLSNGLTQVKLQEFAPPGVPAASWIPGSFQIAAYITPTANMQLMLTVSDDNPDINITEAGLDFFAITDQDILGMDTKPSKEKITLYPNPIEDVLHLSGTTTGTFRIMNPSGKTVMQGVLENIETVLNTSHLQPGMYIVQVGEQTLRFVKR